MAQQVTVEQVTARECRRAARGTKDGEQRWMAQQVTVEQVTARQVTVEQVTASSVGAAAMAQSWGEVLTGDRPGRNRVRASSSSSSSSETVEEVAVPNPEVIIDNMADAGATIVTVRFGNYLEDLVDTCAALRALNLNVVRAKLCDETNRNTFYITNLADGEKVTKADKLEEIRMTILTNIMEFHPESKEKLILGVAHMPKASTVLESMEQNPLGPRPSSLIPTKISCKEHPSGSRTELTVETTDRPGLLTDIVKLLKDISVNVMSAEIDTVGLMAHDVLYVSYHGAALDDNMMELVTNVLQYYLSKAEVSKEESY
ncbi:ACT domain-containing protein [Pseudoscourfieldia marina]